MEPLFSSAGKAFSLTLAQVSTMTIADAFVIAGVLLVVLILLAALATLANRWLSHSIDRLFEWLLLAALFAALLWLFLGGYQRLM